MMPAILVNYNFTPTWLLTSGLDYLIYDRSEDKHFLKDFPQDKIIYTENIGQVDFDKLTYLFENYDTLPDVFLWGKTNLFKYLEAEEWEKVKDSTNFLPLLSKHHKIDGYICYYHEGMYYEINNSWYVGQFQHKYCNDYSEFADRLGLINPKYLGFAPGGNYLLTKETVHKHPKELYAKMRDMLGYCQEPAEAQMCERSYFNLWK